MSSDGARSVVGPSERQVAVWRIGFDDRDDLVGIARKVWRPDAVVGANQRDRHAIRWQARPIIDVVHALQRGILPTIDLKNDALRTIQPGLVVPDR